MQRRESGMVLFFGEVFPIDSNVWTVLDGELAVPCNSQSAIVGLNSRLRPCLFWTVFLQVVLTVWALCKARSVNPVRTGR